jgi:3-isopropylmalate/(R)-2-methylmalate dehydratase small subunit
MQPFTKVCGTAAPLPQGNVDTDVIMPKQFLKGITREGLARGCFYDLRYDAAGNERPEFILNQPGYRQSVFLAVGPNFGCGSSREHAVWAVAQAGFRAVVAPGKDVGFADIFEGNAYNNGLLPVELPETDWNQLAESIRSTPGLEATIDLESLTLTIHQHDGDVSLPIEVPEGQRERLLQGLDAIAETLMHDAEISRHESSRSAWLIPATA